MSIHNLNESCDECWNCEWFIMNDYNDLGCCGSTEPCKDYSEYKKEVIDNDVG